MDEIGLRAARSLSASIEEEVGEMLKSKILERNKHEARGIAYNLLGLMPEFVMRYLLLRKLYSSEENRSLKYYPEFALDRSDQIDLVLYDCDIAHAIEIKRWQARDAAKAIINRDVPKLRRFCEEYPDSHAHEIVVTMNHSSRSKKEYTCAFQQEFSDHLTLKQTYVHAFSNHLTLCVYYAVPVNEPSLGTSDSS